MPNNDHHDNHGINDRNENSDEQQHFNDPFGYNLTLMNGIGLPDYHLPRPQPAAQHILNPEQHHHTMDWLEKFSDTNTFNGMQTNMHQPIPFYHDFETLPGQVDPAVMYNDHNMQNLISNNHISGHDFSMASQFATAAPFFPPMNNGPSPVHSHDFHRQPFQAVGQPLATPGRGPAPNFGSDMQFGPNGYQPTAMQLETNQMPEPEWLSSNPNTRPNTQPSSPIMSRKRKFDSNHEPPRNGIISPQRGPGSQSHSRRQSRVSIVKAEPTQEPTPNSLEESDSDIDAHAESDNEQPSLSRTTSPSQTSQRPSTAPRSRKNTATPASKARRKGSSGGTPVKSKASSTNPRPKAANRTSSISTTTQSASRRQPLTLDEKKRNHTTSEQRRRDAAARAQARLWDMCPGTRVTTGKPSQVQRLAKVVAHVREVQSVKAQLVALLNGMGGMGVDFSSVRGHANNGGGGFLGGGSSETVAAAGALAGMGGGGGSVMFEGMGMDHDGF